MLHGGGNDSITVWVHAERRRDYELSFFHGFTWTFEVSYSGLWSIPFLKLQQKQTQWRTILCPCIFHIKGNVAASLVTLRSFPIVETSIWHKASLSPLSSPRERVLTKCVGVHHEFFQHIHLEKFIIFDVTPKWHKQKRANFLRHGEWHLCVPNTHNSNLSKLTALFRKITVFVQKWG